MREDVWGVHRPDLMTSVFRVEYDFLTREGRVYMPAGNCTDMSGAIRLFRAIDPDVRAVRTFGGDLPDTSYRREADGRWQAFSPDGRGWGATVIS